MSLWPLFLLISLIVGLRYEDCGYQSQLTDCPGTAYGRMNHIHHRLSSLNLHGISWSKLRMDLVNICGLKNNSMATAHCFADWTHVDCCTIVTVHSTNTNEHARVTGMHEINQLGPHITQNSILIGNDYNGSWCTCHNGAPNDVCHLQFGAMIAFKLVWCPNPSFTHFIALLVDNDGNLLNSAMPHHAPSVNTKIANWNVIQTSNNLVFKTDMIRLCERVWKMNKREL